MQSGDRQFGMDIDFSLTELPDAISPEEREARQYEKRRLEDRKEELRNEFNEINDELQVSFFELKRKRGMKESAGHGGHNPSGTLQDLMNVFRNERVGKEAKVKTMKNVLHVMRLQNSAAEAEILDQYMNPEFAAQKGNEDNYKETARDEEQADIEIAYYFPLRNEKNVEFLQIQLDYLENKLKRYDKTLEIAEAASESLHFKYSVTKKDLNIIQARLIGLKKVHDYAESAEDKANKAMVQAHNVQTTIKLKTLLVDRMKLRYKHERDKFYDKLDEEEQRKVAAKSNLE